MRKDIKIAVIGATGLVGRTMIKVLEERNFPVAELYLYASARSAGQTISFKGKDYKVEELTEKSFEGKDIALFSAGGEISKKFAPISAKANCVVIDNSSAWRMDSETPLIVPEVNSQEIKNHKGIIANPNCSTIQLMVALKPIHDKFRLKRVICSTYQSISGAGQSGVDKLENEIENGPGEERPIAYNTLFHPFESNGFTNEENKMINESRKILGLNGLKLAFTCVRLPILGGHAESVNFETEDRFEIDEIKELLSNSDGIIFEDDINQNIYPTPFRVNDTDPVYVGRLRKDDSVENGAYMWVVADNLRKGAATNAVQIAEKLLPYL